MANKLSEICRFNQIRRELKEQNRLTYFKFENKNYWDSARKIKDNWQRELKEKGISVSMTRTEYPIDKSII